MARQQLVFVLGDQLSPHLSSLRAADPREAVVLMVEVGEETTYAWHHKKKIALVLSAMRHFAGELRALGWKVDYVRLDAPENTHSLTGELLRAIAHHGPSRVFVTAPSEWRVMRMLDAWREIAPLRFDILPDDRFILGHAEFDAWADGERVLRLENFYRAMRRRTGLLLDAGGEPLGGRWNFDKENRRRARGDLFMPHPAGYPPDATTGEVLDLVARRFPDNPGRLEPFSFAVTRKDAEAARDRFIADALPWFGDFQDAMLKGEKHLYHAMLSPYLNLGLLDPLDLCWRVQAAFEDGRVPLNAAEGFIRQVIGWREFVRGIYWREMPAFRDHNALEAHRPLPAFYWSGETDMACMRHAIGQTLDDAYAHHIQRLMVTGNFALLAGLDPGAVHDWYLAVYADAFEWVELPNTIGLSLFGDGGMLGSKPYAASAAYLDKMSDYCSGCAFDPRRSHGETACPFNFLYWDFLDRNAGRLSRNARMKGAYALWAGTDERDKTLIRKQALRYLEAIAPSGSETPP